MQGIVPTQETVDKARESFYRAILEEYADTAALIYLRWRQISRSLTRPWVDIHFREDQMEALVDALVVGQDAGLDICLEKSLQGTVGQVYTATRVFFQNNRHDLIGLTLASLSPEDHERLKEATDALKHEAGVRNSGIIQALMNEDTAVHPHLASIGVELAGYNRLDTTQNIRLLLLDANLHNLPGVIWAAGRIKQPPAPGLIKALMDNVRKGNEQIGSESVVSLLRIGNQDIFHYLQALIPDKPWACLLLGISGGPGHLQLLLDALEKADGRIEFLLALGFFGHPDAVPALLPFLEHETVSHGAGDALHLITGAEMDAHTIAPPEKDENSLFDLEIRKLKSGKPSFYRPEYRPDTVTLRRPETPMEWRLWWRLNRNSFKQPVQYRFGRPCRPSTIIAMLKSEKTPAALRLYALEELAIRFGIDAGFETGMQTDMQKQILHTLSSTGTQLDIRFNKNAWFYNKTAWPD